MVQSKHPSSEYTTTWFDKHLTILIFLIWEEEKKAEFSWGKSSLGFIDLKNNMTKTYYPRVVEINVNNSYMHTP